MHTHRHPQQPHMALPSIERRGRRANRESPQILPAERHRVDYHTAQRLMKRQADSRGRYTATQRRALDKQFQIDALRNSYICQRCRASRATEAHHGIRRRHDQWRWDTRNAAPLCSPCHRGITDASPGYEDHTDWKMSPDDVRAQPWIDAGGFVWGTPGEWKLRG